MWFNHYNLWRNPLFNTLPIHYLSPLEPVILLSLKSLRNPHSYCYLRPQYITLTLKSQQRQQHFSPTGLHLTLSHIGATI